MSVQEWITTICMGLVIVASLLSIHWSRQATRDWKRAEENWKRTAEIYRGMP